MQKTLSFLTLFAVLCAAGNTYGVLFAGSNTYFNYRHQADVCHAYQLLRSVAGIPDDRLIVFMYDDIVNNEYNYVPGIIINEVNGTDVYAGVPKDFVGDQVTFDNLRDTLLGKKESALGKKLTSTADDNVFVYFSDHGSPGALCVMDNCSVTGPMVQKLLEDMAATNKFKKLVLYIEACYAGSVFYNITLPENVYVLTASPIAASSFACNFDSSVYAYVSDCFSAAWLADFAKFVATETFDEQYEFITNNIDNSSWPCQYGDTEYSKATAYTEFFAANQKVRVPVAASLPADAIPAWDVPFETARRRAINDENSLAAMDAFKFQSRARESIDALKEQLVSAMSDSAALRAISPPCSTCDETCKCYKSCRQESNQAPEVCEFECCSGVEACTTPPPTTIAALNMETAMSCFVEVSRAFTETCGFGHDYLMSVYPVIDSMCRAGVDPGSFKSVVQNLCATFTL